MKSAKVHYIHSLSYSARDRLAGAFVLIALFFILTLFVSKVNISKIFDSVVNYQSVMKNSQGITVETVVNISGIDVGRVDDIYLGENNEVNVHFFVYKKFQPLVRADSIGELSRSSIVGDNIIIIKPGSPNLPMLADNATIQIKESDNLALTEITPAIKSFTSMASKLSVVLDSIDPNAIRGSSQDLQMALADIRKMSEQITEGKGSLGRMLYDKNQERQVVNSLMLIEKALSGISQRIDEAQPMIANINQLAMESKAIVEDAAKLSSESQKLMADVHRSIDKLDQQLSYLPTLINSANLVLQSSEQTLNGLQPIHVLLDNGIWPLSSNRHPVVDNGLLIEGGADE